MAHKIAAPLSALPAAVVGPFGRRDAAGMTLVSLGLGVGLKARAVGWRGVNVLPTLCQRLRR